MSKYLIVACIIVWAMFGAAPEAQAWGAARSGYSYRGAGGGFYHTSSRASYGPYGEHTSTHTTGYSPYTGFYHSGSGQTSGYGGSAYNSTGAYGNAYGGYGYASAGAYRRW